MKNWGRWGADDQLGSVNLITAEKRKQALSLAKTGQTVSLVHNPLTDKADDNASPFEHTMDAGFTTDTYKVRTTAIRTVTWTRLPHPLQGSDL